MVVGYTKRVSAVFINKATALANRSFSRGFSLIELLAVSGISIGLIVLVYQLAVVPAEEEGWAHDTTEQILQVYLASAIYGQIQMTHTHAPGFDPPLNPIAPRLLRIRNFCGVHYDSGGEPQPFALGPQPLLDLSLLSSQTYRIDPAVNHDANRARLFTVPDPQDSPDPQSPQDPQGRHLSFFFHFLTSLTNEHSDFEEDPYEDLVANFIDLPEYKPQSVPQQQARAPRGDYNGSPVDEELTRLLGTHPGAMSTSQVPLTSLQKNLIYQAIRDSCNVFGDEFVLYIELHPSSPEENIPDEDIDLLLSNLRERQTCSMPEPPARVTSLTGNTLIKIRYAPCGSCPLGNSC